MRLQMNISFEIPDSVFKTNFKADTRQGIAVEYLPNTASA
jgi:hypothetical protein